MTEIFLDIVSKINSQALKDYKFKIRKDIYKHLEEFSKNDEFSRFLVRKEIEMIENILAGYHNDQLKHLLNIYKCLRNLENDTFNFKE